MKINFYQFCATSAHSENLLVWLKCNSILFHGRTNKNKSIKIQSWVTSLLLLIIHHQNNNSSGKKNRSGIFWDRISNYLSAIRALKCLRCSKGALIGSKDTIMREACRFSGQWTLNWTTNQVDDLDISPGSEKDAIPKQNSNLMKELEKVIGKLPANAKAAAAKSEEGDALKLCTILDPPCTNTSFEVHTQGINSFQSLDLCILHS